VAAVLADPVPPVELARALSGSSVGAFIQGRRAGLTIPAASRNALVEVTGTAGGLVLDAGRETVQNTVNNDERATGWARVSSGHPCSFCALLVSRGPVYKGPSFRVPHLHCGCTMQPVYGAFTLSAQARDFQQTYKAAARGQSDKANAFRRAYERP
jgi:hypothetical protein